MSSAELHTESIQTRQEQNSTPTVHEQHARGARNTGEQHRRGSAFRGRRLALAAALAVGVTSGVAMAGTSPSHVAQTVAQAPSSAPSTPALNVAATSASFVRRTRALEGRGYVSVACEAGGDLMFNPRTHRYMTVRA